MTGPHRLLGVLGGMGPAAGAEFLRLLTALSPATRDQEHFPVVLLSDPQIPDRTEALLGRGENPTSRLREDLFKLISWGADLLAIPCNTAHAFVDRFIGELSVPLVHIVEETLNEAIGKNSAGGWLIATEGTLASGIYQDRALRKGFTLHLPSGPEQAEVNEIIRLVKANRLTEAGRRFEPLAASLWKQAEVPILTACTETPLAYRAADLPEAMTVSSLEALARGVIREFRQD
ncbi:MAG: aspartate/glutamate racemase family protein [Synergistales bacterium]